MQQGCHILSWWQILIFFFLRTPWEVRWTRHQKICGCDVPTHWFSSKMIYLEHAYEMITLSSMCWCVINNTLFAIILHSVVALNLFYRFLECQLIKKIGVRVFCQQYIFSLVLTYWMPLIFILFCFAIWNSTGNFQFQNVHTSEYHSVLYFAGSIWCYMIQQFSAFWLVEIQQTRKI